MSNPRTTPSAEDRPDVSHDVTPDRTHPSGPLDGTQATSGARFQRAEKTPPLKVIAHYELIEKLGEGGMGAVYKGWHPKMQRFGAVKLLPAEVMQNSALVARFEHEIALAAKLDHPLPERVFSRPASQISTVTVCSMFSINRITEKRREWMYGL